MVHLATIAHNLSAAMLLGLAFISGILSTILATRFVLGAQVIDWSYHEGL